MYINKLTEKPLNQGESGSTLLIVVIMTVLGSMAAAAMLYTSVTRMQIADKQVALEQAFYIANAGAERAAAHIGEGNESATTLTDSFGEGEYSAEISNFRDTNGELNFNIVSEGTVRGITKTITIRGVKRVSWARYALWYDREATALWIAPGERFDGRVYSRPVMRFHDSGLPSKPQVVFTDRAWSAASNIEKASNKVNPVFEKGLTLKAELESMAPVNFPELLMQTQSGNGHVLEGETTITINGPNMLVTNARNKWTNHSLPLSDNTMVYVKTVTETVTSGSGKYKKTYTTTYPGTVDIEAPNGLQGRITIAAEQDINIVNHVRYSNDPRSDSSSTDALGLIANEHIVVETTAPNNLDIFAHMIAKNGGFGVKNYDKGANRGMLNVYGGIANLIRNAVGLVGSSGYSKNYIFDKRFADNPPPHYPKVLDDLEWTEWEG